MKAHAYIALLLASFPSMQPGNEANCSSGVHTENLTTHLILHCLFCQPHLSYCAARGPWSREPVQPSSWLRYILR